MANYTHYSQYKTSLFKEDQSTKTHTHTHTYLLSDFDSQENHKKHYENNLDHHQTHIPSCQATKKKSISISITHSPLFLPLEHQQYRATVLPTLEQHNSKRATNNQDHHPNTWNGQNRDSQEQANNTVRNMHIYQRKLAFGGILGISDIILCQRACASESLDKIVAGFQTSGNSPDREAKAG